MGFLLSDAMPLDSLLGATTWMHERLTDWVYATDAAHDPDEYGIEDPTE